MPNITVLCRCPFCGAESEVIADAAAYARYISGELIQRAFPNMSADDRELIKTGICNDCFPADPSESSDSYRDDEDDEDDEDEDDYHKYQI